MRAPTNIEIEKVENEVYVNGKLVDINYINKINGCEAKLLLACKDYECFIFDMDFDECGDLENFEINEYGFNLNIENSSEYFTSIIQKILNAEFDKIMEDLKNEEEINYYETNK